MENKDLWIAILSFLLAASEILSYIPKIRASGVFQLLYDILKKIAGKGSILEPPAPKQP